MASQDSYVGSIGNRLDDVRVKLVNPEYRIVDAITDAAGADACGKIVVNVR